MKLALGFFSFEVEIFYHGLYIFTDSIALPHPETRLSYGYIHCILAEFSPIVCKIDGRFLLDFVRLSLKRRG